MSVYLRDGSVLLNAGQVSTDAGCCCGCTGACCHGVSDIACSIETERGCTDSGGTFQGCGTTCSPDPCGTTTGACCIGVGCTVLTSAECTAFGGIYQGDGTVCSPNPCGPEHCCRTIHPTGCSPDGNCHSSVVRIFSGSYTEHFPAGDVIQTTFSGMRVAIVDASCSILFCELTGSVRTVITGSTSCDCTAPFTVCGGSPTSWVQVVAQGSYGPSSCSFPCGIFDPASFGSTISCFTDGSTENWVYHFDDGHGHTIDYNGTGTDHIYA